MTNRIARRRYLTKEAPELFIPYKYEVDLFADIKFCRKWLPQKKWLKLNHKDYKILPEHKRFMKVIKKHELRRKHKDVQYSRAVNGVANLMMEKRLKGEAEKRVETRISALVQ